MLKESIILFIGTTTSITIAITSMLNKLSVTCVSMDSATMDDDPLFPSFVPLRLSLIISILSGALDNDVLDIIRVAMLNIQKIYVLRLNIGTQYIQSSTVKELEHY